MLCLWTDGLVDARAADGTVFSEERLLHEICRRRTLAPEAIVQAVFREADLFMPDPTDDRSLLILRI